MTIDVFLAGLAGLLVVLLLVVAMTPRSNVEPRPGRRTPDARPALTDRSDRTG